MSKISIVVPIYNKEKYISELINSLKNQTYKNFEVLLIDDGSTDNTKLIIEEQIKNDNRFRYIYKPNGGVSSARNLGIENSIGDYISFLDADDYWDIEFLEKMYTSIIVGYDLCYCGYKSIEGDKVYENITNFKIESLLENYIMLNVKISSTSWLINKKIIDNNKIRFNENSSWGEDHEFFTIAIAHSKKITCVPEYLVYYRINIAGQLSTFNLNIIENDYKTSFNIISNLKFLNKGSIDKCITNYRIPAQFTYRLLEAISLNEDPKIISQIYNSYRDKIKSKGLVNGLRSIKLKYSEYKLKKIIKKIE